MSQEWYEKRVQLFEKYTLKSLLNQTNKDFFLWLTFRSKEMDNPVTDKIFKILKDSGIKYLMTFNGTMFTEDRATWHNEDLPERLRSTLSFLKESIGDTDYIYETNLDSDDMIHKDFSKEIIRTKFKNKGALY